MESIIVNNITKTFTLSSKQMKLEKTNEKVKVAVSKLSFSTYSGEIFGLLGPNGAGKTTTLRCLATLIKPDSGEIFINGINNKEEVAVKKQIAFLTNELKLEEQFTPNYLFHYFAQLHGLTKEQEQNRKQELFDVFGVEKFAEVKIGDLSTGMKQKASIVMSLINDPEVIIFDEPTNGLDILTAKVVTNYLLKKKEEGKTVIISTHIMDLVQKICDRVGIIINGKMVLCDKLDKILDDWKTNDLEDVFFNLYKKEVEEWNLVI